MADVFISYKSDEIGEATWVRNALESSGISCWMAPDSIVGGSSYAVEIPQAIKQAKVFVLLLSAKAQESQWVSREVDRAINEGKRVLPFMLENCPLKDEYTFYLTNVQRYAAYENKNAAMDKMVKDIKVIIGKTPVEQPTPTPAPPPAPTPVYVAPRPQSAPAVAKGNPTKKKTEILYSISLILACFSCVDVLSSILAFQVAAMVIAVIGKERARKNNCKGKWMGIIGLIISIMSMIATVSNNPFASGEEILGTIVISVVAIVLFCVPLNKKY